MTYSDPDAHHTTDSLRTEKLRTVPFWVKLLGSGFFSGFFPVAPGTAGSIAALALYWFIPGFEQWYILGGISLLFLAIGIYCAQKLEDALGPGPPVVVIDEMVGMWISLIAVPKGLLLVLSAFLVFRIFDIIKPPPARQFDKMPGGFGIMMDDVAAGIYANIVIRMIIFLPAQF